MDPITASLAGGGIELAKFFLIAYLTKMQLDGKKPEEIDTLYEQTKVAFLAKDPSKIPV